MEAFKTNHLKVSIFLYWTIGCFSEEFMFEGDKTYGKLYAIYSTLLLGYYGVFTLTVYVEIISLVYNHGLRMDLLSGNVAISLLTSVTLFRLLVVRFGGAFKTIVRKAIQMENLIYDRQDDEINKIYDKFVKDINKSTLLYLFLMTSLEIIYAVRPIFLGPSMEIVGNKTVLIKTLPISTWLPFNKQNNYLISYIWSVISLFTAGAFITYTDLFMFNLMAHPIGEFRVLCHILSRFGRYAKRFKEENRLKSEELAAYRLLVDIVRKHNDIIGYVNNFNKTMRTVMLYDFLQSSFQVAFIVMQISGAKLTLMLVLVVFAFFLSMVLRLYLYYYYANEMTLSSENLGHSIWTSDWHERPKNLQHMIMLLIMRSQKPLKYFIGAFGAMSLQSFISILRAAYHYINLLSRLH